jgi:anti-sigma regulatory factor (Ser/Thr protein kinase)
VEDPDTGLPLEERRIGGLGIFLARQIMDEISYRRHGGRNITTMVKRRCPAP